MSAAGQPAGECPGSPAATSGPQGRGLVARRLEGLERAAPLDDLAERRVGPDERRANAVGAAEEGRKTTGPGRRGAGRWRPAGAVRAAALRSGRIVPPINALLLRRYIPASLADTVAAELRQRFEDGAQPRQLAAPLD